MEDKRGRSQSAGVRVKQAEWEQQQEEEKALSRAWFQRSPSFDKPSLMNPATDTHVHTHTHTLQSLLLELKIPPNIFFPQMKLRFKYKGSIPINMVTGILPNVLHA